MRDKPNSCAPCTLFRVGRGFLSSEGTGSNGVLIVGESAGAHEARASLPFRPSAPSGGFLEALFESCGFKRLDFTIFNIVNCQPPDNDLDPYLAAIEHCRQYLDELVLKTQPKVLLALGNVPLRALTDGNLSVTEARGFVLESRYGIPLISSYHPSYLVRGAAGTLRGVALHDLKQAVRFARLGVPERIETHYDLFPTATSIRNYITQLEQDHTIPIAYDVETAWMLGVKEPDDWRKKTVVQIQFSSQAGSALVLPWPSEAAVRILGTPNMKWGWNDRLSDRIVLKAQGVVINGEQHDLMNAWAHLQPGFMSGKDDAHGDKGVPAKLMGLQSCLSFYYPEEGPYKGVVQLAAERGYDRVLAMKHYGAKDADYTFRLGVKLFKALKDGGLW